MKCQQSASIPRFDRRSFLKTAAVVGSGAAAGKWGSTILADEGTPAGFGDVARFIEEQIAAGAAPGAGIAVQQHGKLIYEQYQGTYANHDRADAPFDGDVVNPLYSLSKLVGATVIVMLHDQGLLDYDVPVSTYIPEFTGGGKDTITIRHLLTHSAGIPAVPLGPVGDEPQWELAVETLCAAKVDWEPGSRSLYHGLTGLFVCAEAAQRVTGQKWEQICQERLFEPLGAPSLTFQLPPESVKLSLSPIPEADKLRLLQVVYGSFYKLALLGHPAGSCFGRPLDVLKVLQLHLNEGEWKGKQLISKAAIAEMHTVQYARQIDEAAKAGRQAAYQSWGLGPLMRGTGAADTTHSWFGFHDQDSPGIFGHAGISTIIGIGDPSRDLALVFVTTDSPKPNEQTKAPELRNGVTNRLIQAIT